MVLNSRYKLMILEMIILALTPSLNTKFIYPMAYVASSFGDLTGISELAYSEQCS